MIELRYVGEFDKRLQIRHVRPITDKDGNWINNSWGPWEDVPTVPADSDKLPDTD